MPGPKANPNKPYSRYRPRAGEALVVLPNECDLPAPPLPAGRRWTAAERALWADLWRSPQASRWDDANASAVALLVVYTRAVLAGTASAWQAQEARHLSDRLGLTPSGMAALGWTYSGDAPAEAGLAPVADLADAR